MRILPFVALQPLLAALAESDFAIESDLTEEEPELIAEGSREYDRDPSSFKDRKTIKKELELA